MTRREQLQALLPATLPQLMAATGLSRGNLSRVIANASAAGEIQRVGIRRKYVYHPATPRPTPTFDLQRVWR